MRFISQCQSEVRQLILETIGWLPFQENCRPFWLYKITGRPLELDFYIPALQIAVEVQGAQHARYIPHFHFTSAAFQDSQERDREKRRACQVQGLTLVEIWEPDDVDRLRKLLLKRRIEWDLEHKKKIGRRRSERWREQQRERNRKRARHYLHTQADKVSVRRRVFEDAIRRCLADAIDKRNARMREGIKWEVTEVLNGCCQVRFKRIINEPTPTETQTESTDQDDSV